MHDLLLNISRKVSAFLVEEKKDLESFLSWYTSDISFKISPTFLNTRGLVFLRLIREAEWKRQNFHRTRRGNVASCSLHTLSGLDSFFSTFSLIFMPETGQQCCEPLPNHCPSEVLAATLLCLPFTLQSHFFFT